MKPTTNLFEDCASPQFICSLYPPTHFLSPAHSLDLSPLFSSNHSLSLGFQIVICSHRVCAVNVQIPLWEATHAPCPHWLVSTGILIRFCGLVVSFLSYSPCTHVTSVTVILNNLKILHQFLSTSPNPLSTVCKKMSARIDHAHEEITEIDITNVAV